MHLSMPRHRKVANSKVEEEEDDDCGRGTDKPGQRNAANARERARMRILSKAFSRLKTTLPWVPPDTKLSKLDTLRLATSYIAHLRTILMDDGGAAPVVHPLNLIEMESTLEYPYFVYGQGWTSCSPERTLNCYGLQCSRLKVGDICLSLSPRQTQDDEDKVQSTGPS